MNELLLKYQTLGELRHTIFYTIYEGNLSVELKEILGKSYMSLLEEQTKIFEQVMTPVEGV